MKKLSKKSYDKPKIIEKKIELGVYGDYSIDGGGDAGRELPGTQRDLKNDWLISK